MAERTALPDLDTLELAALKKLLIEQHQQLQSKDEQLQRKDEQLASRDSEIEHLKLLISKLRRETVAIRLSRIQRLAQATVMLRATANRVTGERAHAYGNRWPCQPEGDRALFAHSDGGQADGP